MNVLPMANFQAPEVHWLSLAPILIVLGGAVLGILVEAFAPAKARRPIVVPRRQDDRRERGQLAQGAAHPRERIHGWNCAVEHVARTGRR